MDSLFLIFPPTFSIVSEILIVMSGVESLNAIIVHNNHSELKSSSHHLEVQSGHSVIL